MPCASSRRIVAPEGEVSDETAEGGLEGRVVHDQRGGGRGGERERQRAARSAPDQDRESSERGGRADGEAPVVGEQLPREPDAIGKMKQFATYFTHGIRNGSKLRTAIYQTKETQEVLDCVDAFFSLELEAAVA